MLKTIMVSSLFLMSYSTSLSAKTLWKSCEDAGGSPRTSLTIERYFSDGTRQNTGVFIFGQNDMVWRIGYNGMNDIVYQEQLYIAKTAFMLGAKVNICTDKNTSPHTIWSMEISAKS